MKLIDLTGKKFGRLTVIKILHKDKWGVHYWFCQCMCGNTKKVAGSHLKSGKIRSCGCLRKIHGMSFVSEYHTWQGMKDRCLNKNRENYKDYGGRGIKVCKEWLNFENFYKDMGDKPSKNHSIDRIDNNGNYCKKNCRWATNTEQNRNTRTNKMITYKGETKCLAEWTEKLNTTYSTLWGRLFRGGDVEKVFENL